MVFRLFFVAMFSVVLENKGRISVIDKIYSKRNCIRLPHCGKNNLMGTLIYLHIVQNVNGMRHLSISSGILFILLDKSNV